MGGALSFKSLLVLAIVVLLLLGVYFITRPEPTLENMRHLIGRSESYVIFRFGHPDQYWTSPVCSLSPAGQSEEVVEVVEKWNSLLIAKGLEYRDITVEIDANGMICGVSREERPKSMSSSGLRRIWLMLKLYQEENGALPYSERGSTAALYKIKELYDILFAEVVAPLDASQFNLRGNEEAHWDEAQKRLVGGGVIYANHKGATISNDGRGHWLLRTTPHLKDGYRLVAWSNGEIDFLSKSESEEFAKELEE